jgi:hypothetical protein
MRKKRAKDTLFGGKRHTQYVIVYRQITHYLGAKDTLLKQKYFRHNWKK